MTELSQSYKLESKLMTYASRIFEQLMNARHEFIIRWVWAKRADKLFNYIFSMVWGSKVITKPSIDEQNSTPLVPSVIKEPNPDLDVAQQLRNFCDDLDSFLIKRIESETKRLPIAHMLEVTITASQFGRTMLDLMRNDLDNLIGQKEDFELNKKFSQAAACEKILIMHTAGFIYNLKKYIKSFLKVAICLNGVVQNPGHTRNQQELLGILNIIESINQRFISQPSALSIIGFNIDPITSDWQEKLFSKLIKLNDPETTKIIVTLAQERQYNYILIQSKISALETIANLYAVEQKNKLQNSIPGKATSFTSSIPLDPRQIEIRTKQKGYLLQSRELEKVLGSHCPKPKTEDFSEALVEQIVFKGSTSPTVVLRAT